MDPMPITIIIRITGLLLLTSADANFPDGRLPAYIFMPQTGTNGVEKHSPEIGYWDTGPNRCENPVDGICWVSIEGYSLTIGHSPSSTKMAKRPYSGGNLSHAVGRTMGAKSRTQLPGEKVAARIRLYEGFAEPPCVQFQSTFDGHPDAFPNVVEWRINNYKDPDLRLTLRGLNGNALKSQKLPPLFADSTTREIELFVRHNLPGDMKLVPFSSTVTAPNRNRGGQTNIADHSARHMDAIYDMLGVPKDGHRPHPEYAGDILDSDGSLHRCLWTKSPLTGQDLYLVPPAVGTFGCMVASGFTS